MTRLGGWLFRHRTIIPVPLVIAVVGLPPSDASQPNLLIGLGIAITAIGEAIRLWAVQHIGAISRTRSDRLGPLVAAGPFALVRNPLYLGNIALWVGFVIAGRLLWLVPIVLLLLAVEYHAIVRWEEQLLEGRFGDAYRSYVAHVPRWIPSLTLHHRGHEGHGAKVLEDSISASSVSSVVERLPVVEMFSWRETLFSERGTLIAMAAGYLVLWLKARS